MSCLSLSLSVFDGLELAGTTTTDFQGPHGLDQDPNIMRNYAILLENAQFHAYKFDASACVRKMLWLWDLCLDDLGCQQEILLDDVTF